MIGAARVAALAGLLALPFAATALSGDSEEHVLRDAEFGVTARGAVGLERRVAMYQWDRLGQGIGLAWRDAPVDSSAFPPGHENPPEFPLQPRRWLPGKVSLDGHPVSPGAIEALARWEPMRPDFSALPGNLSATFQPEGDGLGSADNPVHPEPGDLRITWHALRMPATREALVLEDGTWVARHPMPAPGTAQGGDGDATPVRRTWGWVLLGMLAAAVFAGVLVLLRRRR